MMWLLFLISAQDGAYPQTATAAALTACPQETNYTCWKRLLNANERQYCVGLDSFDPEQENERHLQSSKVVPGEARASRLRSSSRSLVTCLSWNRTASPFSLAGRLSLSAGGGEEALEPATLSTSPTQRQFHQAITVGHMLQVEKPNSPQQSVLKRASNLGGTQHSTVNGYFGS